MPSSRSNNGVALASSKSARHKPARAPRQRAAPAVQRSADLRKNGGHQRSSTAALDDTNVDWEARARSQQAILDSIADAVVFADNQGRLTYFNPVAEDLIGARSPDLPPDQWSESYGIYYPDTVELRGARCLLTGVRPAVAQTLASLRVDLGPLLTLRNLRHGLETCIRLSNMGGAGAQLQRDEAVSARHAVRR
ncbi:PAS domain-containing protein [Sorangium sp. So ce426]|uniref:PAS domain-containing protein n=1 Tax=unclassified Sorangium TaxID=2621164 RepID=UPI003F5BA0B3